MNDEFSDSAMNISDPVLGSRAGVEPETVPGSYVCPFCGTADEQGREARQQGAPCPRCGMSDTSATRKATRNRIGSWYVRQQRNPWAPGMRWETLLMLVRRGQVNGGSVVRGPTTQQ